MADIEKIKVKNTTYDVRDASAAHSLTDVATAGNNITFTTPTIDDYSIQGTDVTVTSGVASGFTQSSYIYKGVSVWNSAVNGGSFVLQIKFKINSYESNDYSNSVIRIPSSNADNGTPSFSANITRIGRLKFWDSNYAVTEYTVSTGVDYWLREVYNGGSTVSLQISTDGTNFTEIHTENFEPSISNATNLLIGMGKLSYSTQLLGSIDLTQTYIKDGNGNVIWAASAPSGVTQINATVPTKLSDMAASGYGISIVDGGAPIQDFDTVGSPIITDNTISGLDYYNYITSKSALPSSGVYKFVVNCTFTRNTSSSNYVQPVISNLSSNYGLYINPVNDSSNPNALSFYDGGLNAIVGNTNLSNGKYWFGLVFDTATSTVTGYQMADDGTYTRDTLLDFNNPAWTQEFSVSGVADGFSGNKIKLGSNGNVNYVYWVGDMYLPYTFVTVDGNDFWNPVLILEKSIINVVLPNTTVTLASANWSSNTQTVTVAGMTSSKVVWISPAPASASDYASGGVLCTAQGTNSLTFTCDTTPTNDISVNVVYA